MGCPDYLLNTAHMSNASSLDTASSITLPSAGDGMIRCCRVEEGCNQTEENMHDNLEKLLETKT